MIFVGRKRVLLVDRSQLTVGFFHVFKIVEPSSRCIRKGVSVGYVGFDIEDRCPIQEVKSMDVDNAVSVVDRSDT